MFTARFHSRADPLQRQVNRITRITDDFCARHLDEEYAGLCRRLVDRLRRWIPHYPVIARGVPRVWAASVIQTIGSLNRLFHPASRPHFPRHDIFIWTGITERTTDRKEEFIRRYLGLDGFEPDLLRLPLRRQHPGRWLISFNGANVDARTLHPDVQEQARRQGLIPAEPWNYDEDV